MSYIVTNRDRMSMIEILKHTWNVQFRASRDRPGASYTRRDGTEVVGIPAHTRWDIQAVNPVDNTYHTTDGESIAEAVTKWFTKIAPPKEEPLNINSLYEAKLDFINADWDK